MKYYNKRKAMEVISRYDMFDNYQLTFSDYYIKLLREDEDVETITIVFLNDKVGIGFEHLGCFTKDKLHELYLLTEELEDCVVK